MSNLDEILETLRGLAEAVPNPGRLPSEKEVELMEEKLGVTFPPDYRRFLLNCSDVCFGTLEPATIIEPKSHTYLPDVLVTARAAGVPKHLFPFCEDNSNFFCLTRNGEVAYWSHDGAATEVWESLASWIEKVWLMRE